MDENIKKLIIHHLNQAKKDLPDTIRWSNKFTNTIYQVILGLLYYDKKIIFLQAPTGTGKTYIGIVVSYVLNKINEEYNTYYLTSTLALQDQIKIDVNNLNFDWVGILSSASNYTCHPFVDNEKISKEWSERNCIGMSSKNRCKLDCYDTCKYYSARAFAITSTLSVLNYDYFLTAMKSKYLFTDRFLTICDECHNVPEKIVKFYSIKISTYNLNKFISLLSIVDNDNLNFDEFCKHIIETDKIQIDINLKLIYSIISKLNSNNISDYKIFITYYIAIVEIITKYLSKLNSKYNTNIEILKIIESLSKSLINETKNIPLFLEIFTTRPDDIFIRNIDNGLELFDLSEKKLIRENLINEHNKFLLMSATMGDIDKFTEYFDINSDEYLAIELETDFDFSKSPIYLMKSGYLNRKSFANNIDKVIADTYRVCSQYHPNEKGIIHTHTFNITNLFKKYVENKSDNSRYLFYNNSKEKEELLNLMKNNSDKPYVIIGPSLTEGIDLKDDLGKFNILIKVPFPGIDDYLRKRIENNPEFYDRLTTEKILQSVGRTNRNKTDQSIVYLMDSDFVKICTKIYDISFQNRLKIH